MPLVRAGDRARVDRDVPLMEPDDQFYAYMHMTPEDDDEPWVRRVIWALITFAVVYFFGYHFLLRWVILGS